MDDLERLVQAVRQNAKYRNVCVDVVRNLGAKELAGRQGLRRGLRAPTKGIWKEAVKATRSKLHQVGAAYLERDMHYAVWAEGLRAARAAGTRDAMLQICRLVMQHQSSTRERLGILEQFYAQTLADIAPVRSVLDIACGLNPLAIPWMPLAVDAEYYAYDMYSDMVAFLNEFLGIAGVRGNAEACDVAHDPPTQRAELALLLKSLPCLEHLEREAGAVLLDALQVDHLLISFPVRSLGGRDKGMIENYAQRFEALVGGKPWSVRRFGFATELAFLVSR